ncbi:hypothetical protein [Moraxella ovis]|uniref:hypothetical protein n=1 Tax=Moraxella ovis TaxID=29433 RepID=UPI000B2E7126|nr:hypothetical protein [Moraxella ovis]
MNANISVTNSSVLIAPQDTAKARARRQFMWGITLVVLANLLFGVLYCTLMANGCHL